MRYLNLSYLGVSGAAGGEHCDPLHNVQCNPGFECSIGQNICQKKGNLTDVLSDPQSWACPYGQDGGSKSKEYCQAFTEALIAVDPVVGGIMVGALGLINWFAANVFPAYGIFNASIAAGILFQPVADYWISLVGWHDIQRDDEGALDKAWKAALAGFNLPDDIPFVIPKSYMKPDPSLIDPNLPVDYWDGNVNSPEEALLTYLYAAKEDDGWNKFHKYEYDSGDTNGYAYVQSSNDAGSVLDPLFSLCSAQGELCSHGPFGLIGGGWPKKCNQGCLTQIGQSVNAIFSQRISALQFSLNTFTSAIANKAVELKLERDKKKESESNQEVQVVDINYIMKDDVFKSAVLTNEASKVDKEQPSSGSSLWPVLLSLGVVAGLGYAIVYVGKKETEKQRRGY